MVQHNERRRFPRVKNSRIALTLKTDKFDASISNSLNISASGVCCKVDKEIPLMSRVKIVLMFGSAEGNKKAKPQRIETEGVVVREHPVIENGKVVHYDAAIFFDSLSEQDRNVIKDYIRN